MRSISKGAICSAVAMVVVLASNAANAGGWDTVHRFVHRTGNCGSGKEVLASLYTIGTRTSSGEPMRHDSLTAASHEYPLGTSVTVTNPTNGRTCNIRINDRGPYGKSRDTGVKIDFTLGAARCLGMRGTQYVCLPGDDAIEVAGVPQIVDGGTIEIKGTKIRLQGIDVPENDQVCVDEKGTGWTCGLAARDELIKRFGDKSWTCQVAGRDKFGRSLGSCAVGTESVEEWIVRSGWALSLAGSRAYEASEATAREAQAGLWSGAFIPPSAWRNRNRQTKIVGADRAPGSATEILLGTAATADPPSPECTIKGSFSRGGQCTYQRPGGRSYAKLKMGPGQRWFCSIQEAEAVGCRP
ncbi:nuclease [Rhodopseudomonas sp. AAP120]|uniref:RlpA-like double-psi beta-barrel domain-containing protein n=1 Tax=Rhodopseudomonas sp. AAP120 TaxID=1523430 RepID=UPI0006B93D9A|nr:RlpA-like double-psi beta-barrel domain-containing protein [Rhodopseudomonas sp. AAP120]KPF97001.1 nuclease [Rhodopseudomonas sp. AAP120]